MPAFYEVSGRQRGRTACWIASYLGRAQDRQRAVYRRSQEVLHGVFDGESVYQASKCESAWPDPRVLVVGTNKATPCVLPRRRPS